MDFAALEHDGIILSDDLHRAGLAPHDLRRALAVGELLRLRRGAFCRSELWESADARYRHLLRLAAVEASATSEVVFARESAAALWGFPEVDYTGDVVLLDRWRGGGRSELGVVRTSRGASSAAMAERFGRTCTDIARTAIDVCRSMAFARRVMVLDWVLSEANPLRVSKEHLAAEAERARCSPSLRHAIAFASSASGSPGESEARAVIHLLGFPAPVLQLRFTDEQGNMFPDFTWLQESIAGEFDGKTKYTREQYTQGKPEEVVWREKLREDRLRKHVRTVVRIITADVKNPRALAAKLRDAGLTAAHDARGGRRRLAAGEKSPAART